jgi:3-phosphoshikimate 1-carboxyvinyltransferase
MNVTLNRARDVNLTFTAPPSKSYTHRALIAAALADGRSSIETPLSSGDTLVTRKALSGLGIDIDDVNSDLVVEGCSGLLPCEGPVTLDCENSGTSLRLLTCIALLCPSTVTLTGDPRMRQRPIGPLVDALNSLGGDIRYTGRMGFPPIRVSGTLYGGRTIIDAAASSQFVSSLLMGSPCAKKRVALELPDRPASGSYLDITIDVMEAFGIAVERDGYGSFAVEPGTYRARRYTIEGDYSSASYFFAIAAACEGKVAVENLNPGSLQGDRLFLSALEDMGCIVSSKDRQVVLERTGPLRGIEIDMSTSPDAVPTLCAVAAFADTPTRITGIGHLKFKESDRIEAIAKMLGGLGIQTKAESDALTVYPGQVQAGWIEPQNDHRIAMAGAVLGLGAGNVTIGSAECVIKSFPGFWDLLSEAGL